MLNEEKVRLMTQAATCYKRQEKKAMRINEYYKRDYVNFNVIKSICVFSLAYLIAASMIALYNFEWMLGHAGSALIIFFVIAAVLYIALAAVSGVVSYRIHTRKYQEAKNDVREYYQLLLKLDGLYGSQNESGRRNAYDD